MEVKQPAPTEEPYTLQSESASAEADMNIVQSMLDEMVKIFGGEDAARQKLKSLSEKEQGSYALPATLALFNLKCIQWTERDLIVWENTMLYFLWIRETQLN